MKDQDKSKKQLIDELAELRQKNAELERSEAEESLRESEEKYRNIVELSPDAIVTVSVKGIIRSCNKPFTSVTGFSIDEIIGKHFSMLPFLKKQDIPKYLRIFTSLLRGKVPKPVEVTWIHKDRTSKIADLRFSLMKKDSKISGIQVIGRDITERNRAEEEINQRTRELTALNAVAAVVSQSLNLDEILNNSLDKVLEIMNLKVGGYISVILCRVS